MGKFKLRLHIEAETPPNQPITWKSLAAAFLTSLAAGVLVALLL
jgi:hypothetical protein